MLSAFERIGKQCEIPITKCIGDPSIGRFTGVDPIADEFPHLSGYNYASNDPISKIDLHGLQGIRVNGNISINSGMAAHEVRILGSKFGINAKYQSSNLASLALEGSIQLGEKGSFKATMIRNNQDPNSTSGISMGEVFGGEYFVEEAFDGEVEKTTTISLGDIYVGATEKRSDESRDFETFTGIQFGASYGIGAIGLDLNFSVEFFSNQMSQPDQSVLFQQDKSESNIAKQDNTAVIISIDDNKSTLKKW